MPQGPRFLPPGLVPSFVRWGFLWVRRPFGNNSRRTGNSALSTLRGGVVDQRADADGRYRQLIVLDYQPGFDYQLVIDGNRRLVELRLATSPHGGYW